MSNPFRSCNRTNPCPCCGDVRHECKRVEVDLKLPNARTIDETMILCVYHRNDLPEYVYWGETNNSRWGKYIHKETADALESAWGALKAKKIYSKAVIPKPQKQTASFTHLLPPQQRHDEISKLLSQLELAPRHQINLAARGFDPQTIAHYQFKTIEREQKFSIGISDRLAGVAPGGINLNNKYSGILIPIRDESQLYSGWQTRLDYHRDCKYLWPTGEKVSVHQYQTGEIPLSYVLPMKKVMSNIIALVEGVGFKAVRVANRYGQITIGASGALFASSPQQFARFLKEAAVVVESNRCLLYPDAGAVRNYLVMIQYHKLASRVKSLGFELKVAWWGQFTKAQPDIDEYSGKFKLITWQQFCQFARRLVIDRDAYNNWLKSNQRYW